VCVLRANAASAVAYALTTTSGPVVPGQTIQFTVTATNLSSAVQAVYLNYTVPKFTTSEGDGAGTTFPYNAGNVAAVLELSAISRGRHKVRDIELYDPQRHPGSPKRIAHHTGDHGSGQRRFGIPYCVNSTWPRVKGSTRHADDWCWLIPYLSRL
jgi:hypothetical protein